MLKALTNVSANLLGKYNLTEVQKRASELQAKADQAANQRKEELRALDQRLVDFITAWGQPVPKGNDWPKAQTQPIKDRENYPKSFYIDESKKLKNLEDDYNAFYQSGQGSADLVQRTGYIKSVRKAIEKASANA